MMTPRDRGAGLPAGPRYDAAARRVLRFDRTIAVARHASRPRYQALNAKIIAGTAPVVPTGDGPNSNFPTNDKMVRHRENFASVIYTKR